MHDHWLLFIVSENEFLSVSAKRGRELETLKEIIRSLSLRLRDRGNQIKELQQSLSGRRKLSIVIFMTLLLDLEFKPKVHKPINDQQGLEETQILLSQVLSIPLSSETTGNNPI